MDKHTLFSLSDLLIYIYDDEFKDYYATAQKKNHIFKKIKIVKNWLEKELKKQNLF